MSGTKEQSKLQIYIKQETKGPKGAHLTECDGHCGVQIDSIPLICRPNTLILSDVHTFGNKWQQTFKK